MAIRKNTKRIDPRYFLSETATKDLEEEYKMGDPEMALTTAQVMAAQEAGIDPRSDLYMILLSATQGNSSKHLKALQHPAFQEDPRVKKMGY
jgi:hypothetical protein